MTLPNAERAVVEASKVRDHLLAPEHITVRDGGTFPLTVRLPQSLAPAAYRVRFDRFAPAATNSFDVFDVR